VSDSPLNTDAQSLASLRSSLAGWASALGFAEIRIADADLGDAEHRLDAWLQAGYHGHMDYMAAHGAKRARPAALVPGTLRVISARMDYLPRDTDEAHWRELEFQRLADARQAVVSVYARGRDYHKVLRSRLQQLAEKMTAEVGPFGYRVFTDSAPVMEVEIAQRAGLGWRGKHTLLLNREAGSLFFLGEIYTDLPLPPDAPQQEHCGSCTRCIDICPTRAIVAPYQLDARRCISYLTIELKGAIPEELRPLVGNRVYGCDDCQLVCPWNRFARSSAEPDFAVRHGLDDVSLVELFAWDRATFESRMAGSAIYRIGYERWLRNLSVGLGNAPSTPEVIGALRARAGDASPLVREHVAWALARHHAS